MSVSDALSKSQEGQVLSPVSYQIQEDTRTKTRRAAPRPPSVLRVSAGTSSSVVVGREGRSRPPCLPAGTPTTRRHDDTTTGRHGDGVGRAGLLRQVASDTAYAIDHAQPPMAATMAMIDMVRPVPSSTAARRRPIAAQMSAGTPAKTPRHPRARMPSTRAVMAGRFTTGGGAIPVPSSRRTAATRAAISSSLRSPGRTRPSPVMRAGFYRFGPGAGRHRSSDLTTCQI